MVRWTISSACRGPLLTPTKTPKTGLAGRNRQVIQQRKLLQPRCHLQRRLQLAYGAVDLKRTESGDYYFLEVNPAGQWQFAERLTGLPITQAMADYLAMREDSRRIAAA